MSDRIIPAYAGSTGSRWLSVRSSQDHPRVCGEHSLTSTHLGYTRGSSPRMRGARGGCALPLPVDGIIPAYAGSTENENLRRENPRDHPRVCGEHFVGQRFGGIIQGSSPRMRGAPLILLPVLLLVGIIPAYAGSTGIAQLRHARRWGSSPRMRGAQTDPRRPFDLARIIPAYAGSTLLRFCFSVCFGDHPRVCGEHRADLGGFDGGSSPRMRGALPA